MRHASCVLLLGLLSAGCAGGAGGVVAPLPQREAGLWEVTLTAEPARRERPAVTRECTDAETDAGLLLTQAPGQEHCGETQVRKTGPEWQVSTACRVHDNPIDTTFTFRGNFRTDYAGRFEVRYGTICPRNLPECRETREFTARRLGDCPADLHPGDRMLPNGIVVRPLGDEAHRHEP